MSARDDSALTERERAVLASLEAWAESDDPRLAMRLSQGFSRGEAARRSLRIVALVLVFAATICAMATMPSTLVAAVFLAWFGTTGLLLAGTKLRSRSHS